MHRARQSPASSTIARLQKGRDALGLCNSFPVLPCGSGRSALLCLPGASLRYDGTGRLTCRMAPCVAPSLASFYLLWDLTTSGHISDRLWPRDLFICLQTPVPGHIPAAAASQRHDVRMAIGVAVDGDRPNRLITMPRAPRMLVNRSLMPRKEQNLSLLLCPPAVGQARQPPSIPPILSIPSSFLA